ncbi:polynucleotide adenylyltransferase [Teratosphaeriaceae sp. CCFEE 6253]|nr:polynucleotide adenylyltransferase [Teratosphaeriaceae sp. CCFEE 6253]
MREFKRAEDIVNDIYMSKKPWSALFERHDFFTEKYKHYICVNTAAKDQDAHDAWTGLVQSKIKWLMKGIEESDANSVELVQPYTKGFDRVHECNGADQLERTLDGSLEFQIKATKTSATDEHADIKAQIAQSDTDGVEAMAIDGETKVEEKKDGPQKVYTTTYYLGIGLNDGAKALDISVPVRSFSGDCQQWPGFNADMHSIRIKHIRNYDLPPDVFVAGETRPVRPKKKAKTTATATANGVNAANNKRSFSNAGMDVGVDRVVKRQAR